MTAPALQRYPCPASLARTPTNNYNQKAKPGGGWYQRPVGHGGSDIKPKTPGSGGDPIYPSWPGTVADIGQVWGWDYGKQVLVRHDLTHGPDAWHSSKHKHAWWEFHGHLLDIDVSVGQAVTLKTKLGEMGRTGTVTNVHDHCEYHLSPEWTVGMVDPFPRLNARRLIELNGVQPQPDPEEAEMFLFKIGGQGTIWQLCGSFRAPMTELVWKSAGSPEIWRIVNDKDSLALLPVIDWQDAIYLSSHRETHPQEAT